jgi:NADH-quinone oxidoreductase subunit L
MFRIETLLILIPALPLAAALVTAALGKRILGSRSHMPVLTALALSLTAAVALLAQVHRRSQATVVEGGREGRVPFERVVRLWNWATVGGSVAQGDVAGAAGHGRSRELAIDVTLRVDALTAVMLVVVTCVSLLVAIYSVGYMRGDPGYWRFFTYIALFVFSMTMLVTVSNFAMLYVFWEAVGLCSYLLIGFWFEKPAAAAAGKKAFLVNRVGDFGFALGIFLLWLVFGTLDFHDILVDPARLLHGGTATAVCLLLMLGACGKSAQVPLHVWLPDAMEGPTPVSALIHAATMVTAGVYMVARCAPLFAASPDAQHVVAVVGAATALLAAVIAITQTDLKRILAYSTISQLGYMFLALGTGTFLGTVAGMFHLVTHAFFKGLLFLGAGSVMHAMGNVIDIRRFGGLRRVMPVTCATFLIGAGALAGVAPLAGFWSKDAILASVWERSRGGAWAGAYAALYWVALATALLTAFYTFRAVFCTFFGPVRIPEEAGHHAHESPRHMTVPLIVLAIGSVGVGAALEWRHALVNFLGGTPSLAHLQRNGPAAGEMVFHWDIAAPSTAAAAIGIGMAWFLYLGAPGASSRVAGWMRTLGLFQLSDGKFYFDRVYDAAIVRPLRGVAAVLGWADREGIDGAVDLIGSLPRRLGGPLRSMHGGLISYYAMAMILALLVLVGALLI